MNAVMPRWPRSGAAFANTTKTPASMAFEIQHLLPSINQSLPSCLALDFKANASEPLPASERQKLPTVSVAKRGKYVCFCTCVPYWLKAVTSKVFWISISTATAGSTIATSSTAKQAAVKPAPTPPNSSGTSMPIKPRSKSAARTSGQSVPPWSISWVFGAKTSRANFAAESRKTSSSSVVTVDAKRATREAQVRVPCRGAAAHRRAKANVPPGSCRRPCNPSLPIRTRLDIMAPKSGPRAGAKIALRA
mmetsp:Transcript_55479/g.154645  ORF Transcript_55479/g.154645 Transcript_55479/m.154645 type:complete len:249 (+) Transcript_55479:751-1497(+)